MEIGLDSFAAAFDENSRAVSPAARVRHLIVHFGAVVGPNPVSYRRAFSRIGRVTDEGSKLKLAR